MSDWSGVDRGFAPSATPAERDAARRRVTECVSKLATAIAAGQVQPSLDELRALLTLCEEQDVPAAAARVRRWMAA